MKMWSTKLAWLPSLLWLAVACAPAGEGGSQLKLALTLPGPIVPEPVSSAAIFPNQDTQVTIVTEGEIWIELRSPTGIIASALFNERAGRAELTDLVPGSGYTLGVYAGILARNPETQAISGKLRFAAEERIDLPPDETLEVAMTLKLCDQIDNLSEAKARDCDPDFGVQVAPPPLPEVFPVPPLTGCSVGGSDQEDKGYVVAGTKSTDTVLKDNNDEVVVSDTAAYWSWNLYSLVFDRTTFSRNLQTAHSFNPAIKSTESVQIGYTVDAAAICFNPYQTAGAGIVDIQGDDADMQLNWAPGSGDAKQLMPVVLAAGTAAAPGLTTAELDALIAAGLYPAAVSTLSGPGNDTLTLPRPAGDRWDLYLYVLDSNQDFWRQQGAFRYDTNWIADHNHPAGP